MPLKLLISRITISWYKFLRLTGIVNDLPLLSALTSNNREKSGSVDAVSDLCTSRCNFSILRMIGAVSNGLIVVKDVGGSNSPEEGRFNSLGLRGGLGAPLFLT